jgi:DNA-binding response OmpR family regulator
MPIDSRFRILLVEDNPGDAVIIEDYIATAGQGQFDLRRARTLREGLQLLEDFRPHVVLLDLNLPDSKGSDTIDAFCAAGTPEVPRPPIIVLTSLDDQDVATRAIANCAQDYLVKGELTSAQTLIRSIRFAIQRHGQAEVDKMLVTGDRSPDSQREALSILTRVNRTSPGDGLAEPSAHSPESGLMTHFATGQRATEVIVSGLDRRLRRLEEAQQDHTVGEARRELLWIQLEKLLLGDGKGPLASRLETLERFLIASADDLKHRRDHWSNLRIAIGVLVVGWLGSIVGWLILYFMRHR